MDDVHNNVQEIHLESFGYDFVVSKFHCASCGSPHVYGCMTNINEKRQMKGVFSVI